MRFLLALLAILVLARGSGAETLENALVKVTLDAAHGGAITTMLHKQAVTFPFIAAKGAGVAGTGRLFTLQVRVEDRVFDLSDLALTVQPMQHRAEETVLRLTGSLDSIRAGLSLERVFAIGAKESGFRCRDTFHYTGTGARDINLRAGGKAHQRAEAWCLHRRCWFGDAQKSQAQFAPSTAGAPVKLPCASPRLFWRAAGQYGVGFLYQTTAPQAPVEMVHALPSETGCPADFEWLAAPVSLAAGQSLTMESAVLIDEGGRQENEPSALASSDRIMVMADLCTAGRPDESLRGFGSVVSAIPRQVKMVASQYRPDAEANEARSRVAEIDLTLEPGKTAFRAFEFRSRRPGPFASEIAVYSQSGARLAAATARALIVGERPSPERNAVVRKYATRLPEFHARGSWAEIAAQLIRSGDDLGPFKPRADAPPNAAALIATYESGFPFYAEFLKGAAKALRVTPDRLVSLQAPTAAVRDACMDVFFNGPDGPINAFSKERESDSLKGLAYVKVIPAKGYRYHMYTLNHWSFGYGANSEGLTTSGASINCDDRTETAGAAATRRWKAAGRIVAPLGTHMMLAMCRDVPEALAFIENPAAPFEFPGNMLLVDRAGNAAVLESVGILRQVRRYSGKGLFATGNYSHQRPDGLFQIGTSWGLAANTMLRERFLERVLAPKNYEVSLKDAFSIMQTHALPGGMCQHIFENPASLYSSTSYLAVAQTGDLYISAGPPCEVHYERYTLHDRK